MKKIILFILLFLAIDSYAQRETNIWYFGRKAGLDFNSGSPVVLNDGKMSTNEGCATISNGMGELLFYTDGMKVWNKNHQVMPNGTGLFGHTSSTQSAIIVPKPNSSTIYYIFTVSDIATVNGVCYSEVDISLNEGLGDVTSKNIPILSPACEKITAIKNPINNAYWVVIHGYTNGGNNSFLAYSVTASGVNLTPVISNTGPLIGVNNNESTTIGYLKFSPNGTKLLCASYFNDVILFDFNQATGTINNPKLVCSKNSNYGVEFSPSGNVAYVTTGDLSIYELIQFDLTAADIPNSATLLYLSSNGNYQMGALQLASNGKIYTPFNDKNFVAAINNPEVLGTGCNFVLEAVQLGESGLCKAGLPQFIQSYFNIEIITQNTCVGQDTDFELSSNQEVTSAIWDFGDGSTSTDISPVYQYSSAGTFTVTVTASIGSGSVTKTKEILISAAPTPFQPQNLTACDNNNSIYIDTSTLDSTILNGQTGMEIRYFDENNNQLPSPLPNPFITTSTSLKVEVFNTLNITCVVTFTIPFVIKPVPDIILTGEEVLCSNAPTHTKTIDAGLSDPSTSGNYSYIWYKDGIIIPSATGYNLAINTAGIYTVTVINIHGCSSTRTVTVIESEIATINAVNINDLSSENNIVVIVSGQGDYVYSLENQIFQESNTFYNVEAGTYNVFVKDLNGCGIATKEISVLGFPKYFTPNGDGFNDFWNIKGTNTAFNDKSVIYIFDRYGKLVKQISPTSQGWNGTFNGKQFPASDYWYAIELEDGRTLKGHFTLKR